MNTNKDKAKPKKATDCIVVTMRVKKPLYEKIQALSKRQHRSLSNQCIVLMEEQLHWKHEEHESQT